MATNTDPLAPLAAAIATRVAELLRQGRAPAEPPQVLLTVPEAAVYLGRTPKALQHMIADGKLPLVRDGRRVHLHRADLDAWIETNKY